MILIEVVLLTILLQDAYSLQFQQEAAIKFQNTCLNLVADPCFEDEKILGKTWTVFYTWNLKSETFCVDVEYEVATDTIKKRYKRLMERFFKTEVDWTRATLTQKMNWTEVVNGENDTALEVLLFPVPTKKGMNVGLFQTVPKLRDKERFVTESETVPAITLALKLFNNYRHLVIADCLGGVITFLVRRDQKHTWREIDKAIESFDFDNAPGFPICKYSIRKKRPDQ